MCLFKIYIKSFGRYKITWIYCFRDSLFYKKQTKELRYANQCEELLKQSDTH